MAYVYHGSDRGDLSEIVPRISSHGKAYVYAAKHRSIALLFLSRWNDYLLTLNTAVQDDNLHITLVERYPDALRDIYAGKAGFLYTLNDANFFADSACWEMELVCERTETPVACARVDDVLAEIERLAQDGVATLYRYPNRPAGIPADDTDMIPKSVALYESSGDLYNAIYCAERFPHLRATLQDVFRARYGLEMPAE